MRRSYNPNQVFLTINGNRIEGGVLDGFVTITPNSPLYTMSRDLSGESTASFNTDRSATASVKVKPESLAHRRLGELARTFITAGDDGDTLPSIAFRLINSQTGERIVESEAVLTDCPELSFGSDSGEREYKFDLPNARSKWASGPSIT